MAKVQLVVNEPATGRHQIYVNGVDISSMVSGALLFVEPLERPELQITLPLGEGMNFEGEMLVKVDARQAETLKMLGWTPPADD